MYLLVSDMHFGKGTRDQDRVKEDDLLHLIERHREDLEGLFLLGDVFDQFIEYHHLVPKGYFRFLASLFDLTESGVPVIYVVGNHDPWHLDYFEEELGVLIVRETHEISIGGCRVALSHGDSVGRSRVARIIHGATRHPLSMALYRTLLPADFAYRFTRFVKNRLESSDSPEPAVIDRLRSAAQKMLSDGRDLIVLAHSHHAELIEWPQGLYANTGSWHHDRSVVSLQAVSQQPGEKGQIVAIGSPSGEHGLVRQGRWNGNDVVWYSEARFGSQRTPETQPEGNTEVRQTFGLA
ncbi:MAG: UDP-2,3-diacylglucosamine diphosphatase [Rhodothermia bacterium]|nr:UDP-2,3-diacylglucosamine diphosphatase [Rhodothermia bacterium]